MPHPSTTLRAVVVTWNGAHLLPRCLDSLEAQTTRGRMEVVVVDNASEDGTTGLLADRYPWVRVVSAERNLGFAGGAALGMAGAEGHVVLLNNDARFAPDAVERLLAVLDAPGNERVAAVTAKILLAPADGSSPTTVNSTGNVLTPDGAGTDRDWLAPLGTESTEPDVFGFCGGAALLRREALADVGGFDPELFLYYEDTDLSWRMRAAGWTVRYEAGAVAEHDHAASSGVDSPLFRYYNTRNSLIVVTRHGPLGMVLRSSARQGAGLLAAAARQGAGAASTRARARGIAAHLRRLPRTLRERRTLWKGAGVTRARAVGIHASA
ncbi:glycosyltransferase family 2 protein [Cellulomonas soli]|uniref:Glycosyl transferase n=1 Tax=Cellulomonas soli TaxID=931535 RepID=A0A512P7Z8_9CELL|nr:glycosyltransferase family 2 protein [Cellulomonas soli]NYI57547.1 hypothetical protein [Cellulomonas soli]GEP67324.1 glycosyl transferase [Cellulomonas soli]